MVPLLPGRYSGSSLIRTLPPPSRLSVHFPLFTVIESTLLQRFLSGTRRASPVARHVLVTVLSLPPRWSGLAVSISFRLTMLPSPYGCGLGLQSFSLSGPPVRSLPLRPGDSLTSLKDCFVDGLQVVGFPCTCHPSYRVLILTLAGLPPAEHASFCWTHNRACGSPAHGSPEDGSPLRGLSGLCIGCR